MRRARSVGVGAAALGAILLVGGCRTTETAGHTGPAAEPARAGNPPRGSSPAAVVPRRLVVLAAMPEDRDGNGFPDQFPLILYLFGSDELPVRAPGTVRASLRLGDGEILRRWAIPAESLARAERAFPAGPGYELGLQLDRGQDVRSRAAADLIIQFEPAGDPSRVVGGLASIHIGSGAG